MRSSPAMPNSTLVADPPKFFIPYAIDLSIGVDRNYFDGLMLASFIGLSVLRCWLYTKSSDEKWPLRSFVAASIISEIAHTVVNWNIKRGDFAVNKAISNYMIGAGLLLCIQAFFAARIYYAGLIHRFVPMIILCSAFFAFAASNYGNDFRADPPSPAASWVSNPVFVNGMLAHTFFSMMSEAVVPAALAWSLGRPDEYGVKKTTPMLEKLLYYIIARGILVMLAHIFFLVEYPGQPRTLSWIPLFSSQSKIFAFMTVVILTSRSNFQNLDLMELSNRIRANVRPESAQRPQPVIYQQNGAPSSSQEARVGESPSPSTDTTKNKAEKVALDENV
ncbi:hypothetical protein Moror_7556 [Moniliophthora roreri MCA 2997]|uniref:DUF6534 domain-containing protein n=1 Tax=Moniliophthora roreri (strain MCA 2997) TaxID=1381753 RepID=V2WTN3_MONRO|nr:hypothetical protein Moror_7556 [Moniliophthora roreri MCA 2997]